MRRMNFTEDSSRAVPKVYPYYIIELARHSHLTGIFRGSAMDGPLHDAWLYPEDQIKKAVEEAKMVGGTVRVVYMSDPISLEEFCSRDDTSCFTRNKCHPYCNVTRDK